MRIERLHDPAAFLAAAEDHLLADEARHNLILGLTGVLVGQPDAYPEFSLLRAVGDDGETAGVTLRTPPHFVSVSAVTSDEALDALVRAVAAEDVTPPGVIGGLPEARSFAERYCTATGTSPRTIMEQGIYVLREVVDLPAPSGAARVAGPEDLDLVMGWTRAFHAEAGPDDVFDEEGTRRRVTARLAGRGGEGLRIWDDGGPVCYAGFAGPTRHGIRVGPVYTPPELRGRGYATALVSSISRAQLASGRSFCFLYTDMDNPQSNAIYRRIGYRLHCGSAMIRFD